MIGNDQLNLALLMVYILVVLLQAVLVRIETVRTVLEIVSLLLALVILFRSFSKNLARRRAETARFLNWWRPVKSRISGAQQRRKDKDHKYFTCKSCKTICRVPVGKGKIEITCPKCGGKIIGRS